MSREFFKKHIQRLETIRDVFQQECWAPFLRLVVNKKYWGNRNHSSYAALRLWIPELPDGLRGHISGRAPLFSGVLCCG